MTENFYFETLWKRPRLLYYTLLASMSTLKFITPKETLKRRYIRIPVILSKNSVTYFCSDSLFMDYVKTFDILLISLDFLHFVSVFPMIVSLDGGTQWVDRGNTFAFLEVIGGKLKEMYSIWWKKELSTTFSWTNTSWYSKT